MTDEQRNHEAKAARRESGHLVKRAAGRRVAPAGHQPAARTAPAKRISQDDPGASAPLKQGLITLRKRADFLAANRGQRFPTPGFVLLVRQRDDGDDAVRVGFTITRKIGNAVVRNRMKRRFRELARELIPAGGVPGADHVMIGRAGGVERDFGLMRQELASALSRARA